MTHPERERLRRYAKEQRRMDSYADDLPEATEKGSEEGTGDQPDANSQNYVRQHELRNTDE